MGMAIIKRYWSVSIFKETPANTPYSLGLLLLLAIFFWVLIILQWHLADVDQTLTLSVSCWAGIALVLSYGFYTAILLYLFHVAARTIQTLSCLLACHSIVHVFAFPLLLVAPWLIETTMMRPLALLVAIVYLIITIVLTIWQFMITVHIYKRALMIETLPAILASVGMVAFNILVVSLFR